MAPQSDGFPLLSYAAMVWRRRVLVLIVALGMVVPAFAVSAWETPQYQATGQILLTQQQLDESLNVKDAVLSDTQINNKIATLTGVEVAERARQQGATSPVRVVGRAGSNVVTLSAQDPDPRLAAATVEAYVRAFSEHRTQQVRKTLDSAAVQLQNRIAGLQEQIKRLAPADRTSVQEQQAGVQAQLGRVQTQQGLISSGVEVVQNPTVGQSPVSPTPVRNALLALVLGLTLGISLAVLLETLRRRSPAEPAAPHTEPFSGASAPTHHEARFVAPAHRHRGGAPAAQPRRR